ncbi:MAG: hypothetical protein DI536_16720 [Archangium gephyra]|uniref:Tetratricopeptide repeat protein n=1 Tax=Archangium gephyra TaxID=48 RepID=A0A2W5TDI5_9BACT|nr:MAG: hypothetical protein DI536_16720 [Archangium gephyra]
MTGLLLLALSAAPNPFLAEALELEQNLDFEGCVARLRQASTQWQSTPDELRDIEVHAGLCTFNLGKTRAAEGHFRMALRLDENTALPPYTSPKALELFAAVKRALPHKPFVDGDLAGDAPLKDPVAARPVLTPEPPPQRTFGQLLGSRVPSLISAGVAVVSLVTGILLATLAQDVARQANAAHFETDFYRLGADARGLATGATISWVVAAVATSATVVTWLIASDEEHP